MQISTWFDWLDFGCGNSKNCRYDDDPNDATLSLHNGMSAALLPDWSSVVVVKGRENNGSNNRTEGIFSITDEV